MGGAACTIIIQEGNISYAVIEQFSKQFPEVKTEFLSAAVKASCSGIEHASLYLLIEGNSHFLSEKFTQPIIDLHQEIIVCLQKLQKDHATINSMQKMVDSLFVRLITATRAVTKLFDKTVT